MPDTIRRCCSESADGSLRRRRCPLACCLAAGLALGRAVVLAERLDLEEEDVARDGLRARDRRRCRWRARSTTRRRRAGGPAPRGRTCGRPTASVAGAAAGPASLTCLLRAAVHGVHQVELRSRRSRPRLRASTNISSMLVARRSRPGFEKATDGGSSVEHVDGVLRRGRHERCLPGWPARCDRCRSPVT